MMTQPASSRYALAVAATAIAIAAGWVGSVESRLLWSARERGTLAAEIEALKQADLVLRNDIKPRLERIEGMLMDQRGAR